MKNEYIVSFSVVGGCISAIFNFIGIPISVLVAVMTLDFISGLLVAGYFKNSPKTDTGALSSKVGFNGLRRKCLILIYVMVGALLDVLLNVNYIANAVCFGFIANEVLSIGENAGLMGFKLPSILANTIDILKKKGDNTND